MTNTKKAPKLRFVYTPKDKKMKMIKTRDKKMKLVYTSPNLIENKTN